MEPESSLPRSQQHATLPYPEAHQYILALPADLCKAHFDSVFQVACQHFSLLYSCNAGKLAVRRPLSAADIAAAGEGTSQWRTDRGFGGVQPPPPKF
jgi:hypothetical protein